MPRPPRRTRQLVDPMAAFQMVHIMEGVIQRGTATVLRDLNRPLFGKTGTTNGPTNVWFVGGTPGHRRRRLYRLRPAALAWAAMRRAAGSRRRSASSGRRRRSRISPRCRSSRRRASAWVRIDRASGKPVFGIFPTTEDPKSAVIWEAFQPADRAATHAIEARSAIPITSSNSSRRSRRRSNRRSKRLSSSASSRLPRLQGLSWRRLRRSRNRRLACQR